MYRHFYSLFCQQRVFEMNWMQSRNGVSFPYYRFQFEGFSNQQLHFRSVQAKNGRRQGETSQLRAWFHEQVFKQWGNPASFFRFEHATLIIFHHFDTKQATDLDNYAYKIVIDAIKATNCIENDDYEHLSLHLKGLSSERAKLDCFVVPTGYELDFFEKNTFYKIAFSNFQEVTNEQIENEQLCRAQEQNWFY